MVLGYLKILQVRLDPQVLRIPLAGICRSREVDQVESKQNEGARYEEEIRVGGIMQNHSY